MPKKPPFNHFRKSCLSPSNGNKKKKKELQVPSVPCKGCACLSHRGKGSRRGVPGGPTSPFPEGRHLHVALEQLPAAKGAPGGWMQRVHSPAHLQGHLDRCPQSLQGHQELLLSPHSRGTHWLGTQGATLGLTLYPLSRSVSSPVPAAGDAVPAGPVGRAQLSLAAGCAGEHRKSLCANTAMRRALPSEP